MSADDRPLAQVRGWLADAERITVLTGAGISTNSGIPDFRGPNGLWTKNPRAEVASNIETWINDAAYRVEAWQRRATADTWRAEPNSAPLAVAALQQAGSVSFVVTQNVDELHQAAGSPPNTVIEVHGTMRRTRCLQCGDE